MLNGLTEIQESDEDIRIGAELTISTEKDDRVREYTFSRAPEWGKWTFTEFLEKRRVDGRGSNWRKTKNISWHETEAVSVDVPPEVSRQLNEILDTDIVLQTP